MQMMEERAEGWIRRGGAVLAEQQARCRRCGKVKEDYLGESGENKVHEV